MTRFRTILLLLGMLLLWSTPGSSFNPAPSDVPAGVTTLATPAGDSAMDEALDAVKTTPSSFSSSGPKTADALIKTGAGVLHAVVCNSDAAATAGSFTIYDNTAESGTQIHTITFGASLYPPTTMVFDVAFTTGLFFGFTTTADVTCSASYR